MLLLVFLSRTLHELKGEGNTVDQKEVIFVTFNNRRPSSAILTSKLSRNLKQYKSVYLFIRTITDSHLFRRRRHQHHHFTLFQCHLSYHHCHPSSSRDHTEVSLSSSSSSSSSSSVQSFLLEQVEVKSCLFIVVF